MAPSSLNMAVGDTQKLTSSITPSYAKNQNIKWSSSNTAVAEVDSNGTITAKSEGQTVITATSEDGGKTAECTVNVTR